jgi:putative ABC transport system permease protein
MRWLAEARERVRCLLFRRREEAEMAEELRFHLEMEAERLVREEGLEAGEARRRAAVSFGGMEKYKEEVREARGLAWVSGLSLDLKLALRMMRKTPGLTIAAGLGMALAVGIAAGFFIVAHGFFYPKLPLDEGERVVALENWDVRAANEWRHAVHDFVAWREEMRSVEQISAFSPVDWRMVDGAAAPRLVHAVRMTSTGFQVARIPPLLGRYLVEDDDRAGAPRVAVIGYELWQAQFHGDPKVIGRDVILGDSTHTIVGVMPPGYSFPWRHDVWTPLRIDPSRYERGEGPELFVFGRLAPGATMERARAELAAIGRRAAAASPETHRGLLPQVLPYTYPLDDVQDPRNKMIDFIVGMSFISLLLLVVAANVAILMFARTALRGGEIAVRRALGASRRRIVGQLFLEALVLSVSASPLGLLLARAVLAVAQSLGDRMRGLGFWVDWSIGLPVVLYTIGLALLAAVIVGVVPALQLTGPRLQADLRRISAGAGQGMGGLWTTLIVVQVAVVMGALPLAATAGWEVIGDVATRPRFPDEYLNATLTRVQELRPGMEGAEYRREQASRFVQRVEELTRRLEAEPAVAGVAFTGELPGREYLVEVEGVASPTWSPNGLQLSVGGVGRGYLELLGARTLVGRGFAPGDFQQSSRAVVVSREFSSELLAGGEAVGRRVRFVSSSPDASTGEPTRSDWFEVVGVIDDLFENPVNASKLKPWVYYPVSPEWVGSGSLVVRVRGEEPMSFAPRIREMVAALDPALVLFGTHSLVGSATPPTYLLLGILALLLLGLVALFSAAGIHALMSFAVTRRRKEIGIRTALGAGRRRLLTAIFSRAAGQVGLGIAIGALAGGTFLIGEQWATGPRTAAILAFTATLTALVAAGAAAGPARRGLRIQPMDALREE